MNKDYIQEVLNHENLIREERAMKYLNYVELEVGMRVKAYGDDKTFQAGVWVIKDIKDGCINFRREDNRFGIEFDCWVPYSQYRWIEFVGRAEYLEDVEEDREFWVDGEVFVKGKKNGPDFLCYYGNFEKYLFSGYKEVQVIDNKKYLKNIPLGKKFVYKGKIWIKGTTSYFYDQIEDIKATSDCGYIDNYFGPKVLVEEYKESPLKEMIITKVEDGKHGNSTDKTFYCLEYRIDGATTFASRHNSMAELVCDLAKNKDWINEAE